MLRFGVDNTKSDSQPTGPFANWLIVDHCDSDLLNKFTQYMSLK